MCLLRFSEKGRDEVRDWKYPIGTLVVLNNRSSKGLPNRVGQLAEVFELKTSGTYDYMIRFTDGDKVFVHEDELDAIEGDILNLKEGSVVVNGLNQEVKVLKIDYLHKHVEVEYLEDGSMEVVHVSHLKNKESDESIKQRKSWDEYFMDIAEIVSSRATCNRLHVGCVIVKDKRIVSTGYNGSPSGESHCDDIGHLYNDQNRCIRTIHAEQNAILFANRSDLQGATAYVTHQPCENCAKLLVQSGINRIVYKNKYTNIHSNYFMGMVENVHLGG